MMAETAAGTVSERLLGDRQGTALREGRNQLASMRETLRRKQDKGLTSEDFAQSSLLLQAVEAAEEGLTAYWEKHNKA